MGLLTPDVLHDRPFERAEEPCRRGSVLGGAAECGAVGHVAELPPARSARVRERPVRIEVPWAARRRYCATGATGLAGRLAGHGIRLELDLRVGMIIRGRLLLLEWRGERIRRCLVGPVRPVRRAVKVGVAVCQEEVRAS